MSGSWFAATISVEFAFVGAWVGSLTIQSMDPAKYDGAIAQAMAYATCLMKNGEIQ